MRYDNCEDQRSQCHDFMSFWNGLYWLPCVSNGDFGRSAMVHGMDLNELLDALNKE